MLASGAVSTRNIQGTLIDSRRTQGLRTVSNQIVLIVLIHVYRFQVQYGQGPLRLKLTTEFGSICGTGLYINKPARIYLPRRLDPLSSFHLYFNLRRAVWAIIIIVLKSQGLRMFESRVLPSLYKPLIFINPLILPLRVSTMFCRSGLLKLSLSVLIIGLAIRMMRRKTRLPLPPGPHGLPIIGNVFDIPVVNMAQTYLGWTKNTGTCYSCLVSR